MQNLVLLIEPSDDGPRISTKAGNMCLNRFVIDEAAAFELSRVSYLEKFPDKMDDWKWQRWKRRDEKCIEQERKGKGRDRE